MMNFYFDYKSIDDDIIQIQGRSVSDLTLSDIDVKWLGFELPLTTLLNFQSEIEWE